MYSVDHNVIFEHMYCTEPGNLFNIKNIMLEYLYLHVTKVVLNFNKAPRFPNIYKSRPSVPSDFKDIYYLVKSLSRRWCSLK